MDNAFKWNVDKFTTYVYTLLVTLAENGGKDRLIFEKLYEVLTRSPCLLFNSEIVVYKHVHFSSLNVYKLIIMTRE